MIGSGQNKSSRAVISTGNHFFADSRYSNAKRFSTSDSEVNTSREESINFSPSKEYEYQQVSGQSWPRNEEQTFALDSYSYQKESDASSSIGDSETVWCNEVEKVFIEAVEKFPHCGRSKLLVPGSQRTYGRNELIAKYIKDKTGKERTRKQVSSHLQVLYRRNKKSRSLKNKDMAELDKAFKTSFLSNIMEENEETCEIIPESPEEIESTEKVEDSPTPDRHNQIYEVYKFIMKVVGAANFSWKFTRGKGTKDEEIIDASPNSSNEAHRSHETTDSSLQAENPAIACNKQNTEINSGAPDYISDEKKDFVKVVEIFGEALKKGDMMN
ncbi:MAG: Transcriptional enhancer factor TEF-5 [Marteilia pararefringens]